MLYKYRNLRTRENAKCQKSGLQKPYNEPSEKYH